MMGSSRRAQRVIIRVMSFICELIAVLLEVLVLTAVSILRNIVSLVKTPKYKDISNDIVLVTGGGKGIGRLVAFEFAKHHPKQILLWGRTRESLAGTAQAITASLKVNCDYMLCDVSDRQQVYAKASEVKQKYGDVTILVNNSGVVYGQMVLDSKPEEMQRTINVNTLGQIWTVKAFLPAMIKQNHGHIVSMSSMLGLMGLGGAADYCASKHATVGFMESLGMELHDHTGVHTTCVCPYLVNTDMFAGVTTRFPFLFPALEKEYVAMKTVDATLTNQSLLLMPRMMYLLTIVRSIMPRDALWAVMQFTQVDRCMDTFYARKVDSKTS